jgi:MFS family permease
MVIVFLVIVLDLIGFGIMVPILAYYVVQLGGGPELAMFCMALYAIGMFISTPILARLSDFYGRKPVLMLSMLGAMMGYLLLGFAESLWVVALSRLLAGLMAGNIATAQAYITDVTSEENRAKGMGMIGAALLAIIFLLPESLDQQHRKALRQQVHPGRIKALTALWDRPLIPQPTERGMLLGSTRRQVLWVEFLARY